MDLVDEHNLDDIEILSDEEDEVDEDDEVDEVDEVGDVDVDDVDVDDVDVNDDEVGGDDGEGVVRTVKRSKTTSNAFDDVLVEEYVDPRFFRVSNDQQPSRQ